MVQTVDASRLRRVLASRHFREAVLIALAYIPYEIAHALAGARPHLAFDNAGSLVRIEEGLGVFKEAWLQEVALSSRFLVHLSNVVYFYGHWPVIIVAGLYLFFRRPSIYYPVRNAFLISGALALVFYIFFPVAPPRLAEPEIIDTLAFPVPMDLEKSRVLNPYGAFPSLHVGWDILIAVAIFCAFRVLLARLFAVVLPLAMFVATVTTGNHYIIDGIAGAVVALVGLAAVVWLRPRLLAGGDAATPASTTAPALPAAARRRAEAPATSAGRPRKRRPAPNI